MRATIPGATNTCHSFPWKGPGGGERCIFSFHAQVKLGSSPGAAGSSAAECPLSLHTGLCLGPHLSKSGLGRASSIPGTHPLPGAAPFPCCLTVATHQPQLSRTVLVHAHDHGGCGKTQSERMVPCAGENQQQSWGQAGTALTCSGQGWDSEKSCPFALPAMLGRWRALYSLCGTRSTRAGRSLPDSCACPPLS